MSRCTTEADPMERKGSGKVRADEQAAMREALRAFWRKHRGLLEPMRAMLRDPDARPFLVPPKVPPGCEGLRCGATTRAGTACQIRSIWPNGRCSLHGGKSTGPNPMTREGGESKGGQHGADQH